VTAAPTAPPTEAPSPEETAGFAEYARRLTAAVGSVVLGKPQVVRLAMAGLLAEGHLLIEDVPGVGKTTLARSMAAVVAGQWRRIQFTPDLLPSDVTGVTIYNQGSGGFEFHQGPIFANIVIADEINRASPKTQSALLEVMAEHQVTVDGVTYPLPRPNFVVATQNPIDQQGTYTLPEAQLDRFMMLLRIGYPSAEQEMRIVGDAIARRLPEQLQPVMAVDELVRMIDIARSVYMAPALQSFIVTITGATRTVAQLRLGASPRASNALAVAAQAAAAFEGRSFVTADDVKAMARPVLSHRLLLTPEAAIQGHTAAAIIDNILAAVPVPQDPVRV